MRKTVVINVVGLSAGLIGKDTPFISKWLSDKQVTRVKPIIPAVTCSSQSVYLTGTYPVDTGIVGNGWYFKDECEIKFWKQSNKLVQAEKVWEVAKKRNPAFTCSNMFWWFNMYSSADYSVTPRPMYLADGRKLPDVYSWPYDLRELLQKKLGQFPLFEFWGPRSSIRSSEWIAKASKIVDDLKNPTLTLVYLPHLDYPLQKYGQEESKIAPELRQIDKVVEDLIKFYEKKRANVILLSEYGITSVSNPIHINRIFRTNGLINVREELDLELLDPGACEAFAVADHQVAHIYVNNKSKLQQVRTILEGIEGIEMVLDQEGKEQLGLNHERAGDFVVVADAKSWFTYYYWLDDSKAPDFARTVEIHRKPGYDPVELFTDPNIKSLPLTVGSKLLKKKLGFRTLLDIIPLDANLVKGSHGRIPENENFWPIVATEGLSLPTLEPDQIYDLILEKLELKE
jgi:predicted AlkP superfamily pyrophosphatase or phosphodiesterase